MLSSPNSGACLTNKLQRLLIDITATPFSCMVKFSWYWNAYKTRVSFFFSFLLVSPSFVCQCSIKLECRIFGFQLKGSTLTCSCIHFHSIWNLIIDAIDGECTIAHIKHATEAKPATTTEKKQLRFNWNLYVNLNWIRHKKAWKIGVR